MKKAMKDIFLKLMYNVLKNYINFIIIDHSYKKEWVGKVEKLVANSHDQAEYVIHMKHLKQALNHGLILQKVHRVILFSQKAWLKTIHW